MPADVLAHLAALGLGPGRRFTTTSPPTRSSSGAVRRGEGKLTEHGVLAGFTAPHTGRSPQDRFVVERRTKDEVGWNNTNQAVSEATFDALLAKRWAFAAAASSSSWTLRRRRPALPHPRARRSPSRRGTLTSPPTCSSSPAARHRQPRTDFEPDVHGRRPRRLQGRPGRGRHALGDVHPDEPRARGSCSSAAPSTRARSRSPSSRRSTTCSRARASSRCTARPTRPERRRRRSSSASPAPARRRSRPTRAARSSATTSTAGATTACSTSRAAATPRPSSSPPEGEPEIFATTLRFGTVLENVVLDDDRRASTSTSPDHREHARLLPDRLHPERERDRHRRPPAARRLPHRRRLRRAAAGRAADARAGDVPLPLGLHGQGGRHRARRDRAQGDLLGLLRRAVHGAPADRLRRAARRPPPHARRAGWLLNTGWTGGPYGTGQRA